MNRLIQAEEQLRHLSSRFCPPNSRFRTNQGNSIRCSIKSTTSFRFFVSRVLLVGFALSGVLAPQLHAALFTVNTNADTKEDFTLGNDVCYDGTKKRDGTPNCSLRAAIEAGNARGSPDQIDFKPNLGIIALNLANGPLAIRTNLKILGLGRGSTIIDGQNKMRILQISPGTQGNVEISGVTIQHGRNDLEHNGAFGLSAGILIGRESSLLLEKSDVSSNSGRFGGIAIWNNGDLKLKDCTVEGNINDNVGGGLTGFGSGAIENNGGKVDITDESKIQNNFGIVGGGIRNTSGGTLIIDGSTISGNHASRGGGINNNGTLHIINSTIDGNKANRVTDFAFDKWNGGGISNEPNGDLRIERSTISNNEAIRGGGIANLGSMNPTGSVLIVDSTISGNRAGRGGGIFNSDPVPDEVLHRGPHVTITLSTITNNQVMLIQIPTGIESQNLGGGIDNEGLVQMDATILAGNAAPGGDLYSPDGFSRRDCSADNHPCGRHQNGGMISYRDNVIGVINNNCNLEDFQFRHGQLPLDQYGTADVPLDPRLGPLDKVHNGGDTATHALLDESPRSPAIDSVRSTTNCGTDQRGLLRPAGMRCDAGAFELGALPP
jgi:hypothetical protein